MEVAETGTIYATLTEVSKAFVFQKQRRLFTGMVPVAGMERYVGYKRNMKGQLVTMPKMLHVEVELKPVGGMPATPTAVVAWQWVASGHGTLPYIQARLRPIKAYRRNPKKASGRSKVWEYDDRWIKGSL